MESAEPETVSTGALFVTSRIPEIFEVPAPVMVRVPVIVGVFNVPPDHAAIFTPGVIVTFSVTESLRNIVCPDTAAAIARARVV